MRSFTVVLVAVLLSACSSSADNSGDAPTSSAESSSTAASPEASTSAEAADATQLADELKGSSKTATKVVTITEDNDPNNLIGRPNGYDSAAVIYDAGGSCDDVSSDCGLVIEVFSDEASAKSRGEYIQGILKGSPALGSEWDYVKGNALLRVSGKLSPSTNTTYAEAFGGEEVTVTAK
jgi:hypothetical protein